MLALTPTPLHTDGERAFFGELVRWDTGGAVRGAVVASMPFVDGPRQRRISDAVLFVPEGLAVVRIVEVERQAGTITARADGAWTIGAGAGPGEVLHLSGGGSTPLDGLMRAGMNAAVRLHEAGMEPGRIARLTVLVGDLAELIPADGDLGEGDQVALMDPRSLLLGIARASRYAGKDNPRLWTTADVRAALEALGLQGRGPSVEELNGEGFPYSPYVLRRPQLLTAAAMASSAGQGSAAVQAQASAVQAQAAAEAAQADQAAPPVAPFAGQPDDDTVTALCGPVPDRPAVDRPAVDRPADDRPADDTGGLGGLFAPPDPEPEPDPVAGPSFEPGATAEGPQWPALPGPAWPVDDRSAGGRTVVQPAWPAGGSSTAGAMLLDEDGVEEQTHRLRTAVLVAAAVAVVTGLGVGGYLLLGGGDDAPPGTAPAASAATSSAAPAGGAEGPKPGTVEQVDGVGFTLQEARVDATCLGHAYGAVGDFFTDADCAGLARAVYTAEVDGRPVVVAVARVSMPDTAGARALLALADANGSGNVSDLLREGVRFAGGPAELSGAEYASAVTGQDVTIVETSWFDPAAGGAAADLDLLASSALVLPLPEAPAN